MDLEGMRLRLMDVLTLYTPRGTEEDHKTSARTTVVPVEIRTTSITSTSDSSVIKQPLVLTQEVLFFVLCYVLQQRNF